MTSKRNRNTQTGLEKFLKSRDMIISVMVLTSIAQAVHTAIVIKHLTFIPEGMFAWVHSSVLAVAVETYVVVFSIRLRHGLAVMYMFFGIMVNYLMAIMHWGDDPNWLMYFLISSIFPISVFFTAKELGARRSKKPNTNSNNSIIKRIKKRIMEKI